MAPEEDDVNALLADLEGLPDGVPDPQPGSFLRDAPTRAMIERLAGEERDLTFVIGAGVSMEALLPSWPVLVRRMLARAAVRHVEPELRRPWLETTEEEGPLAAASVVEALSESPREFRADLRKSLFGSGGELAFRPGALAQEIAWAKSRLGKSLELLTLNYDTLVEQALEDRGEPVRGRVEHECPASDDAIVHHLHGRIRGNKPPGIIVLSEKGYAAVQDADAWPERLMTERLSTTTCVFVGLSLTDANLVRWLHRSTPNVAGQPQHVALFVRQAASNMDEALRRRLEGTAGKRWEAAGVAVVWTDFFAELAQVIHEIALLRGDGNAEPFAERAAVRRCHVERNVAPPEPAAFMAAQEAASARLQGMVEGVRQRFADEGHAITDAYLGMALWVVDHGDGTICRLASSDRLHRQTESLSPRRLTLTSDYAAVEAVTRGASVYQDLHDGRWAFVRGIPLILQDDDGSRRLPLGAVTLTSDELGAATMRDVPPEMFARIDEYVRGEALSFFEPTSVGP